MIRLLKRLVLWLESRFPEKLTVNRLEYDALSFSLNKLDTMYADLAKRIDAELSLLRDDVKVHEEGIAAVVDRVARVEASAVHKGAVADLVEVVRDAKAEFETLKSRMGFTTPEAADLSAVFNGEPITGGK